MTAAFASSPEVDELREFIESLNEDEQADLVALAWLGHGTFTADDWDEAVDSAHEEHPKGAADYLLSLPLRLLLQGRVLCPALRKERPKVLREVRPGRADHPPVREEQRVSLTLLPPDVVG